MNVLKGIGRGILELFYPRFCQFCHSRDCDDQTPFVCNECLSKVLYLHSPYCMRCSFPFEGEMDSLADCPHCHGFDWSFERAASATRLRGIVKDILHRFKYQNQVYWRTLLGRWLNQAAQNVNLSDYDAVIPVPLFPRRQRERQYNQSELLAFDFTKKAGLPLLARHLVRIRDTSTQTRLERHQRFLNQKDAYQVRKPEDVKNRSICLVDDVFTTGATTQECSKTLLMAGAKKVLVLTVARG